MGSGHSHSESRSRSCSSPSASQSHDNHKNKGKRGKYGRGNSMRISSNWFGKKNRHFSDSSSGSKADKNQVYLDNFLYEIKVSSNSPKMLTHFGRNHKDAIWSHSPKKENTNDEKWQDSNTVELEHFEKAENETETENANANGDTMENDDTMTTKTTLAPIGLSQGNYSNTLNSSTEDCSSKGNWSESRCGDSSCEASSFTVAITRIKSDHVSASQMLRPVLHPKCLNETNAQFITNSNQYLYTNKEYNLLIDGYLRRYSSNVAQSNDDVNSVICKYLNDALGLTNIFVQNKHCKDSGNKNYSLMYFNNILTNVSRNISFHFIRNHCEKASYHDNNFFGNGYAFCLGLFGMKKNLFDFYGFETFLNRFVQLKKHKLKSFESLCYQMMKSSDDNCFSFYWIECGFDKSIHRYYGNINICNDGESLDCYTLYEMNRDFDELYCFKSGDCVDLSYNIEKGKRYLSFIKNGQFLMGNNLNFQKENDFCDNNKRHSLSSAANDIHYNRLQKGKIELNNDFVYLPIFASVGCNCNASGYEFHARIE